MKKKKARSARGTFPIDRIIPHVGRIKKASGEKTRVEFNRRNAMITNLIERGYLDVLKDVRDGHITVSQVWGTVLQHGYDALQKPDVLRPLLASFAAWAKNHDCTEEYRGNLGTTYRYVERVMPTASITDLPRVVKDLKALLPAPSFNRSRAHLSSFASQVLGLNHAVAVGVRSVTAKTEKVQRKPIRLTPRQMAE